MIHDYLEKKFKTYVAAHPAELREVQSPQRYLTGRAAGPAVRSVSAEQWVAEQVEVAEELLWHKTCLQCHAVSSTALQDVKIARWDAAPNGATSASKSKAWDVRGSLPTIAAARIRLQWLPHARFDHDAHTGFSCASCHQSALKSTDTSEVLIPGIAVCERCHAPGPGYAESRCAECHTYHDWSKRKEVKPAFTLPTLRGGGR